MRRYHDILDIAFCIQHQLMKLLLCYKYALPVFASDVNFVLSSSVGIRGKVAVDVGKRRREVDGGVRRCLNKANILTSPSADDAVQ